MTAKFTKCASERLDYDFDYTNALVGGDTITASVFDIDILIYDGNSYSTKAAKVWIKSGVVGVTYNVLNTITTAQGRIFTRKFEILITAD